MISLPEVLRTVETARFGPFAFQLGVDATAVDVLLLRVEDARQRFLGSPLSQVAARLEREILVSSIFSTNSIEGGSLSEEETEKALQLDPATVQEEEQRRALNIKRAYERALEAAALPSWRLSQEFVQEIHALITEGLSHTYNRPGHFRDNPKEVVTSVGNAEHGGRYKPPQFGGDVALLMQNLIGWHDDLVAARVHPLVRAPLVHYYFELIHPFWDGNGRVGRVLEATVLHASGYRYAPFAMARWYLERIHQYFALFNESRRKAEKKEGFPNTPFVAFHLEGMLTSMNRLHDRVNDIVKALLFENSLQKLRDAGEINLRQYAIVTQVMERGRPYPLDELRRAPWYEALYARRVDKTRQRDLRRLREKDVISIDEKGQVWPGFLKPPVRKED